MYTNLLNVLHGTVSCCRHEIIYDVKSRSLAHAEKNEQFMVLIKQTNI